MNSTDLGKLCLSLEHVVKLCQISSNLSGGDPVHKDETGGIRKVVRIRQQRSLIKIELGVHVTGV